MGTTCMLHACACTCFFVGWIPTLRSLYVRRGGILNERGVAALVLLVASYVTWNRVGVSLEQLEQLRNNFKVQLRWLPLTESTQIFLCDSVCVSSTWVRGPRGPRGVRKKKNLAALFRKVDSSPALVVGPPWRHFFRKVDPNPALVVRPPWRNFFIRWTLTLHSLYVRCGGIFN